MPSIRTVERLVRRGFRPRMPKFIARSWLPVPLFSGALTPGMRLSTSRMVVAPVLAKSSRRITSRAPACSNTSFSRASPSQSPTTVRASSFGAGAGSSVQLLFPSGFTCSPLPSSSCCSRSRRRNRRAGRCSACRASGWRQPRG